MNRTLILVVEDDKPVQNLMTTTLKAHDYKYLTAMNGETAILEASSHNPDIILLDLGLPDMDGIEVIKKIRTWSNVPIIIISARSEDTDKVEALDAGADDYLTKPFSVEELLARLRVTERRLAAASAEQASVSGIRMESLSTEDGLPPCITTGDQVLREGWAAFERASRIAKENGIADMSLDEINAEIAEARKNL